MNLEIILISQIEPIGLKTNSASNEQSCTEHARIKISKHVTLIIYEWYTLINTKDSGLSAGTKGKQVPNF